MLCRAHLKLEFEYNYRYDYVQLSCSVCFRSCMNCLLLCPFFNPTQQNSYDVPERTYYRSYSVATTSRGNCAAVCEAIQRGLPYSGIHREMSTSKATLQRSSGVTGSGRGAGGRVPPWHFSPGILADLPWKERQERKEKWSGKEGKFKREGVNNWKWKGKMYEMSRGPFFSLVTFWNHWKFFALGSTKMGNFYQEKAYFTPGKNQEKWLCPLWKIFLLRHCKGATLQCMSTSSVSLRATAQLLQVAVSTE